MTAGRGNPVPDYGKSPQADALRAQLSALARLEATPVYQEMCAAAERTVMAGGSYVTHGQGEYGPNGELPMRRKVRA